MKRNKFQDDKLIEHLISIPNCPDWLCFFVMFSRFEYALKCSGFVIPSSREAKTDWRKFGEKIEGKFTAQKCKELSEAIKYLQDDPPRKQVQKEGKLLWTSAKKENGDIQRLITAVKTVRNNFFHGCKTPYGPELEPSRDNKLIRHSITVLKYFLYSSEQVKKHYFEPLG